MLDPEAMAVITGAAGNIVAYMVNGEVDTVRTWARRIFGRAGGDAGTAQLRAVDNDSTALAEGAMSDVEAMARWKAILETYLSEHPDVRSEVEALASSAPSTAQMMHVENQRNEAGGVFVGRDNYGGISNHGAE